MSATPSDHAAATKPQAPTASEAASSASTAAPPTAPAKPAADDAEHIVHKKEPQHDRNKGRDKKKPPAADAKVAASPVAAAAASSSSTGSDVVTPTTVSAGKTGVDYARLVQSFGTTEIDDALLARMERLSKRPLHPWLRRRLFFSHRSLSEILDAVEKQQPFYLYTGRGPSSDAMHLGHLVPFMFTKYLQDAFDVPLVVQLTDDEKFLWKDLSLEEAHRLAFENAKDILSCGFDVRKTFLFTDYDYVGHMYPNIVKIQKCITASSVIAALGLGGEDNIGKYGFTAIQAAPSFSSSFPQIFGAKSNLPCLIPCAIDQDPFFRLTRDVAPRLGLLKPAVIHAKFFPALKGLTAKMASSDPTSAVFITDSAKQIQSKVNKYAFSGGRDTIDEHRRLGADVDVDVPYQWLRFFLMDDAKLQHIHDEYKSGRMLTGEVKKELISVLQELVGGLQKTRAALTDEQVRAFFVVRPLEFANRAPVAANTPSANTPSANTPSANTLAAAATGGAETK